MEKSCTSAKIRQLFVKENGEYYCTVSKNCKYRPKTLIITNCCRHIKEQHPIQYNVLNLGKRISDEEIEAHKAKRRIRHIGISEESVPIRVHRRKIVAGLIKLCTLHNCPFSSMEWEGIRDIIDPFIDTLNLDINRHSIVNTINNISETIITLIKTEIKGQLLSLKFDCPLKMSKRVLAINVQFYSDLNLASRFLGEIQLPENVTAQYLKEELLKIYEMYGIDEWQWYSATENDESETRVVDMIQVSQIDDVYQQFFIIDYEKRDEYTSVLNDPLKIYEKQSINKTEWLRCGQHVINLVVHDATMHSEKDIEIATNIVKSYWKMEYREEFRKSGIAIPPIPSDKRWIHYFLMLKELVKNRDFFSGLSAKYSELDFSRIWTIIEEYHESLTPLYDAIVSIQYLDCPISQFHLEWLRAYGRISELGNNRFKCPILKAMQTRQKTLMSSEVYKAAIYMDPRLCFNKSEILTNVEKERTVEFLGQLWEKIDRNGITTVFVAPPEEKKHKADMFNMDDFISTMYGESSGDDASMRNEQCSISKAIRDIQYQKRVSAADLTFNISHYWYSKKIQDERLWKIARVVYAAAATKAMVEKDFSEFNNNQNNNTLSNLSNESIKNVLLIKLNRDLLPMALDTALIKEEKP